MRVALCFSLLLFLAACQTTGGGRTYGSGPVKMSAGVYELFQAYLERDPLAFAISTDGRWASYFYCQEVGCRPIRVIPKAIDICEQRSNKDCLIFAVRDEIVWENPGQWRPSEAEITWDRAGRRVAADEKPSEGDRGDRVSTLEAFIGANERLAGYRVAPGHKVIAISFNESTGDVRRFGFTYGRSDLGDAIVGALNLCERRNSGCELYDVNGTGVWPTRLDDVTDPMLREWTAAGEALPAYEGQRPVRISWAGLEDVSQTVDYAWNSDGVRFDIELDAFETPCVGVLTVAEGLVEGRLLFSLRCGQEALVTGSGIYLDGGAVATLNGRDGEGRAVRIDVDPDPALFAR